MTPPRRVLLVRPSALGDVCRTVPVLASLKAAYPEAEIDWVVRDVFRPTVVAHPALHEAVDFPRARFGRWWRSPTIALELVRWFRALRRRKYDLVIDCQGLIRSALITLATGAPRRVGSRRAREMAWLAYNVRIASDAATHTVDAMLDLIRGEEIEPGHDMRLYTSPDDRRWWAEQRRMRENSGPYAVLAPTARWVSKRWPLERWRELLPHLAARGFERLVVIGAPNEVEQVAGIEPDDPDVAARVDVLLGHADIGRTMAIVADADLVVAHDSAPLHMAIGFDRPCVALFGPTDPALVGPYGRPECVVRRFVPEPGRSVNYRDSSYGDALMRLISVDDVLERIDASISMPEGVVDVKRCEVSTEP